ncbi:MAG: hypothetical protein PHH30_05630 [Bacteroidales bacterium]|jgi:hypothetical protein|nr:hypothetical protein [Bacteroidales bacterium]MDD3858873.1 hypothetical protein [Bacteroidales bacterium]
MKKLFLSFFILLVSVVTFAQPTEAEDFTVTDIDGVEHNLFTYLDQGKYVYVEFLLKG